MDKLFSLSHWFYLSLFIAVALLAGGTAPIWGFYLGLATVFLLLFRTYFLATEEGKLHTVLGLVLLGHLSLFALRSNPLFGVNRLALSASFLTLIAWITVRVAGAWPRTATTRLMATPQKLLLGAIYILLGMLLGALAFAVQPTRLSANPDPLSTLWFALVLTLAATSEELLFRGALLRTAVGLMGARWGVLWSAGIYACFALPLSLPFAGFILLLGTGFSWLALTSRSVIGVSLAHVAVNLTLFIVMPLLWPLWFVG